MCVEPTRARPPRALSSAAHTPCCCTYLWCTAFRVPARTSLPASIHTLPHLLCSPNPWTRRDHCIQCGGCTLALAVPQPLAQSPVSRWVTEETAVACAREQPACARRRPKYQTPLFSSSHTPAPRLPALPPQPPSPTLCPSQGTRWAGVAGRAGRADRRLARPSRRLRRSRGTAARRRPWARHRPSRRAQTGRRRPCGCARSSPASRR